MEWTSLRGADKLKVLHHLPEKIPDIIPSEDGNKIRQLWKVQSDKYMQVHIIIVYLGLSGHIYYNG